MDRTNLTPTPTVALRRIVHIDMDAFYASVEQRDDKSLRCKPVAVGGNRARGVVAAASYEARKFGVRSAMPSIAALRQCPNLVFVPPRFDVYKAVSHQIHDIFRRYTSIVQPLSLDEAYLDVTTPLIDCGSATALAAEIRAAIRAETGLTASAGVSYNKFLAKLASDHRKPDGLFVITPRQGPTFVESLPIGKFHGVGPVTEQRMNALGIFTGLDLRCQSLALLMRHFGKAAEYYYGVARGEDERPVEADRERKSFSAETTFVRDLTAWDEVGPALASVFARLWSVYERGAPAGRTATVKLKFVDFRQITRSRSVTEPITTRSELERISLDLLRSCFPLVLPVRLLGVTISNLGGEDHPPHQLALPFDQTEDLSTNRSVLDATVGDCSSVTA